MVYFVTLFALSAGMSMVCSFTTLGVRGKSPLDMCPMDMKILDGTATFGERMFYCAWGTPIGMLWPPLHLVAAIVFFLS